MALYEQRNELANQIFDITGEREQLKTMAMSMFLNKEQFAEALRNEVRYLETQLDRLIISKIK